MSKLKNPLLSFGARGTIADSLTFQKRNQGTIVRTKPIPKDPKSPAQLAWRQVYGDAVAAWHALTPKEKQAWRGLCPGLTAYQCFLRSELKYVPPPPPIDIGAEAIDRSSSTPIDYTNVDTTNPANASGLITTLEIWADVPLVNCLAGTFYKTNTWTLKCRDSVNIPNVPSGSKQAFSGLSIAVVAGDYIGFYADSGKIEMDWTGLGGVYRRAGNWAHPGDESTYSITAGQGFSLHGHGEVAP